MNFIVCFRLKLHILFLGQRRSAQVLTIEEGLILIGIPEHGKVFGILVVGITWENSSV